MVAQRLEVLNGLRFVAASHVVIFHHNGIIEWPNQFLASVFSSGYESVAFFFILSGFVLSHSYWPEPGTQVRSAFSTQKFLASRVARIFPAYFLALVISLPFYVNAFANQRISVPDFIGGLVLVPILLQAWYPPTALLWNIPAWSLSVELFLYCTFPLIVRSSSISAWPASRFVLVGFSLLLLKVGITNAIEYTANPQSEAWVALVLYFPPFHLPYFLIGIGLSRLIRVHGSSLTRALPSLLVSSILLVAVLFGTRNSLPAWAVSLPVLTVLFSTMIIGGASNYVRSGSLTSSSLLFLGDISYSMYILHWPLSLCLMSIARKFGIEISGNQYFFVYFTILLLVCSATFLIVERPARRKLLRILGYDRKASYA